MINSQKSCNFAGARRVELDEQRCDILHWVGPRYCSAFCPEPATGIGIDSCRGGDAYSRRWRGCQGVMAVYRAGVAAASGYHGDAVWGCFGRQWPVVADGFP